MKCQHQQQPFRRVINRRADRQFAFKVKRRIEPLRQGFPVAGLRLDDPTGKPFSGGDQRGHAVHDPRDRRQDRIPVQHRLHSIPQLCRPDFHLCGQKKPEHVVVGAPPSRSLAVQINAHLGMSQGISPGFMAHKRRQRGFL